MTLPVIILAGGLGKRISSKYKNIQKCMININNKPFLHYVLTNLKKNNVKQVIFLLGHRSNDVIKFLNKKKNFYNMQIQISYDGKNLLGTGGAVKKSLNLVKKNFVLTYADSYLDYNFQKIVKYYLKNKLTSLITVYRNINGSDKSNIKLKNNKITHYGKNDLNKYDYIDWGISIFDKKIFKNIKKKNFDLSLVYKSQIATKSLYGYKVFKKYREIGTPESLMDFKKFINEKK